MDAISLIVTALSSAVIAGSQSALTDAVKDAFTSLKDHILTAVHGKRNAVMVLEEYEKDPKTWANPLKNILLEASVAEDEETVNAARQLIELINSQSGATTQFTYHNHGPIQNAIQGNNYGPIHFTTNTPLKDQVAEGKAFLKRGQDELSLGNYTIALQHLENASRLLHENLHQAENAQVRYLQALAYLAGKRPSSVTLQVMRRVEELMKSAVTLHSSYSYLYTFALFKRDFARNGYESHRLVQEAQELLHQANRLSPSFQDSENIELLSRCQYRLMQDAQQW